MKHLLFIILLYPLSSFSQKDSTYISYNEWTTTAKIESPNCIMEKFRYIDSLKANQYAIFNYKEVPMGFYKGVFKFKDLNKWVYEVIVFYNQIEIFTALLDGTEKECWQCDNIDLTAIKKLFLK